MEPATHRESRPGAASVLLICAVSLAGACILGVLMIWPFAFLYVAVSPRAAFLFVAACIGVFAFVAWRLVKRLGTNDPSS
jgi:hypothetical protein